MNFSMAPSHSTVFLYVAVISCVVFALGADIGGRHTHKTRRSFDGIQSLRSGDGRFQVQFSSSGQYNVMVDGIPWLHSAITYFQVHGRQYSNLDGSLVLTGLVNTSGVDKVGPWVGVQFQYMAWKTPIYTNIRAYRNRAAFVFGQEFPEGAEGTSVGKRNLTLSVFPNFRTGSTNVDLGYLAYADKFVGDMEKSLGRWSSGKMPIKDAIDGGPLALFDRGDNAIFMSPFNAFMVASPRYDWKNGTYGWGITGEIEKIPPHYKMETIIYYSGRGIREVFSDWGVCMRTEYGKDNAARDADFTNNYLSYWTDNGAYYVNYYVPDFMIQNMTYETALLSYVNYSKSLKIPYRTMQYSVWYETYGGVYGGTLKWAANHRMLPRGMAFMRDQTKLASTSHNRWWSSKTPYAKENGGKYNFIIERLYALPQDEQFWVDIFAESQNWGIMNYMQDWLQLPMEVMNATIRDVDVAATWLKQMGRGAEMNGITIQYCMSLSRHVLQSLAIPAVTQVRASDDYQPSSDYSYEQWRIGITSLFADAVGLAPFKDTFWTTSVQPGNFYKNSDPYVELQSLVASLSTGPVGPGDMINGTNRTLLMRCCNEDGLILKPSRPAFPVDAQLKQSAFGGDLGPSGEVWTTYSDIGRYRFGVIFGAAMDEGKNMYAIGPTVAGFGTNFAPSRVYSYRDPGHGPLSKFSDTHPVTLTPGCTRQNFCLFYTSPIFTFRNAELVLLGELSKWIPMSSRRVSAIQYDVTDFQVTLEGASAEKVEFCAIFNGTFMKFHCKLSLGGRAIISFSRVTCKGG